MHLCKTWLQMLYPLNRLSMNKWMADWIASTWEWLHCSSPVCPGQSIRRSWETLRIRGRTISYGALERPLEGSRVEWEVSPMISGTPVVLKGILQVSVFPSDRSLPRVDILPVESTTLLSVGVINIISKRNLGGKGLFQIMGFSPLLREATVWVQGRS